MDFSIYPEVRYNIARMPRVSKPTQLQKRAIDNIVSGRFKSIAEAMREAGYSANTSHRPREKLAMSKGVQAYIESLSKVAKKRWNMSIEQKVALVFLEGLEATKLVGRNAEKVHPDFAVRKIYADSFAKFFGWVQGEVPSGDIHQQFNFFGISEEDRERFNTKFKSFLKDYYSNHH